MEQDQLFKKIDELISLADKTNASRDASYKEGDYPDNGLYHNFRASSLSFLLLLFGKNHPYYVEFEKHCGDAPKKYYVTNGREILNAVKNEIKSGWLNTIKGLISAEIFSDFLEMASYLLEEGFKDAAAVMIGSILEGHLRQLCLKYSIPIEEIRDGKPIPKKAEMVNHELTKIEVYNKLDQKSVTSWLDLRNKAAHGKYDDYTKEQVQVMYSGILDFMNRNQV